MQSADLAAEKRRRDLEALEQADIDRWSVDPNRVDNGEPDAPSEPDYEGMMVDRYTPSDIEYFQDRQQDRYDRMIYGE